jgi:lipopolysaccharide export system protein LptA
MNRIAAIAFMLAVAAVVSLSLAAGNSPVVLENARSLKSFEENGVQRKELEGDVLITKDSLSVMCQKAIQYADSGLLIFRRNVQFSQPGRTLYADEVIYNEFSEEVLAQGHVRIYQDSLKAFANRAVYRERFKSVYLFDDVKIVDDSRKITLKGQTGFFDHEKEYAYVTGSPVLMQRDSSLALRTQIYGDTIKYFGDKKQAHALGNVIIERDSLLAYGSQLMFHQDSSYAELIGQPYAVQNFDNISGDTLRLFFKHEQLEHLEVLGHAVATSPTDSVNKELRNRMEGKKMSLWIEGNNLSRIEVEGNAIATYYIRENDEPKGRNTTSGDVLYVYFADSKISNIEVEGGTRGVYSPERLVRKETLDLEK